MTTATRLTAAMLAGCAALAALAAETAQTATDYASGISQWREQREARLKADGGWLTVAGLFWLEEGANRFGTDGANEIVLPPGSAPARAGVFTLAKGVTTVTVEPGAGVTLKGMPVTTTTLKADTAGEPDLLSLGTLTLHVIQRGDRFAIRLKDTESRFRKEFTGLHWFPIKESYRVTATWVPYEPPHQVPVPTILGTTETMPCPGYAVFRLEGREVRLEPVLEEPGATDLFYIFRDGTSGKETYPSGRFLYSEMPKEGRVVLDFNKAYNPPCAFTPYATCPLPPEQNRLAVRIEAGELNYGHH